MELNTILITIFIPIISGLIGWVTNYIAIKSLFRPYKKVKFLGFTFIGIIPKRKKQMSKNIAHVVSNYLVSHKDLLEKFEGKENIAKIKEKILPIITEKIIGNIPGMFKMVAEPMVKSILEKEADDIILKVGKELIEHLDETFDVEELVEKKLLEYDTRNLETIIMKIAKDEFRHVEFLGAVIGFGVGLFQVALFLVLN